MNLERGSILFNRTIDQCRSIGRRGGRHSATSRRLRLDRAPVPPETEPHVETAAEAIARIDALCPWLRGVESRATRRPAA